MLVLTRCPSRGDQATICIGDGVQVTVLSIEGEYVRLAVTAPLPPSVVVTAPAELRPAGPPRPG